jgi:hypothetical protein
VRPLCRRNAFIVPGEPVETFGAVNFHQAVVYKPTHAVDKALILVLIIPALRCREKDNRVATVAKNQHFHINAKIWRVPAMIFFSQCNSGLIYEGKLGKYFVQINKSKTLFLQPLLI